MLVRSTWDYTTRRAEFLHGARSCRRTVNPSAVLAWNTDKRYLEDLRAVGVPTVPTVFLAPGQPLRVPTAWADGDVVVEPAVSASAADTGRFAAGATAAADLVADLHLQGRTVMVQPYLPAVESHGKTALVFLGGEFSHAVRKQALLTRPGVREPVVGDHAPVRPAAANDQQLAVAAAALSAVPGGSGQLAYARVDLVLGADGAPLLLELELTEPSLFLRWAPEVAVRRLATAVARLATP